MPAFALPAFPAGSARNHALRSRTPRCTAQPPQQSQSLRAVEQRLIRELPTLFTSSDPDYSIYADDVSFEDPLNKFRGTARYRSNIRLLTNSPIFSAPEFHLHSTAVLPPASAASQSTTVRTRWTLTLCFSAAPWRPRPAFTGQSDYVVDPDSGLVTSHVDYWDSLTDASNAFPSPRALADFVSQCAPGSAHPHAVPPRLLLRRTPELEVWRFDAEVRLTQPRAGGSGAAALFVVAESGSVAETESESIVVQNVAAVRLGATPPTAARFDEVVRRLKRSLDDVPYAVPTEQAVCVVVPNGRAAKEHYVWLVLSEASAPVDY